MPPHDSTHVKLIIRVHVQHKWLGYNHFIPLTPAPPLHPNRVVFYLSSHFWQGYAPWSVLGWAWWRGGREWRCAGGYADGCVGADAGADAGGTRYAGRVEDPVRHRGQHSERPGNGCWAPDGVGLVLQKRGENIRLGLSLLMKESVISLQTLNIQIKYFLILLDPSWSLRLNSWEPHYVIKREAMLKS